jgi:small subunit ribosomal protein S4e
MSKHMKRMNAPRTMRVHRKEQVWTVKAAPGPHDLQHAIPLAAVVRDYLSLCDTYREAKYVIAKGDIHVDGQPRKDHKYPCGFMDVLSIPKMKKDYRFVYDRKGKLTLVPISSTDAGFKLYRVEGKNTIRGKKTQLHLHDGGNILVDKDTYHTGDVLHITLKDNKIKDTYSFGKGTIAMITGGSHIGEMATIQDIHVVSSSKPNLAMMKGEQEFSTVTEYVFPIGKTKPVISLPEVKMK